MMSNSQHARDQTSKLIAIIDDNESMQDSLLDLMEAAGLVARCFGSAEEFLESDLHTRAAMREGAVEFLAKPFEHQLLLKTVRAALDL
jgi:FixJ family two-component response regulator